MPTGEQDTRSDMRTGVERICNFCLAGKEVLRTLKVMNALWPEDEELANRCGAFVDQ